MSTTSTPNMGLIVPSTGANGELGPAWANELNGDLGILDQHNHSNGQGVPVTPAGLNINSDLAINDNNLTTVKTVNFTAQLTTLPGTSPNLGCIYVAGNELVYNDEAGNIVPITNNGAVNAGAGSITGLPSGTASASYSGGTFVWQSATNTPANMDGGSFIFRDISVNSKGVTVSAPAALASNYGLVWPLVPGTTSIVTLDSSGNFGAGDVSDEVTLQQASAVLSIKNPYLSNATRPTSQTAPVGGIMLSPSSGSFSSSSTTAVNVINLSGTLVTLGRPVMINIEPAAAAIAAIQTENVSSGGIPAPPMNFKLLNGATLVAQWSAGATDTPIGNFFAVPASFSVKDYPTAGTQSYDLQVFVTNPGGYTIFITNCVLTAYEL